jgi:hypothetical protein
VANSNITRLPAFGTTSTVPPPRIRNAGSKKNFNFGSLGFSQAALRGPAFRARTSRYLGSVSQTSQLECPRACCANSAPPSSSVITKPIVAVFIIDLMFVCLPHAK